MLMLFENRDAEFGTGLASFCRIMGKTVFHEKAILTKKVFAT